ncbi:MAG: hypothetical protein K0Q94_6077, partial [Paenibacillus sp.]|nr:hypothetical protein [Paenibacillus sp.]
MTIKRWLILFALMVTVCSALLGCSQASHRNQPAATAPPAEPATHLSFEDQAGKKV